MPRRFAFVFGLAALLSPAGCVLGTEQAPGCRAGHPEDCDPGFVCRAGACLRYTTETGPPREGGDAPLDALTDGSGSDASLEGGE